MSAPEDTVSLKARIRGLLWHLPAAVLLGFVLVLSLKPVEDPDLWSHLKAGQWMLENMSLPGAEDPFTFPPADTNPDAVSGRRSQWLGQVAWYMAYREWGAPGVVGLRTILMTGPLVLLYVLLAGRAKSALAGFGSIALPALVLAAAFTSTFERPQAFSFAFAVILMLLLVRLRQARSIWAYALLPLLMALWANLHAGYIIGLALAFAFVSGEAVRMLLERGKRTLARPRMFFGAAALSVITAGISPAGFTHLAWALDILMRLGEGSAREGIGLGGLTEYKPMWFFMTELRQPWPVFVSVYLAIGAAVAGWAIVLRRRWDALPEVLASAMMGIMCLVYVRLVPFAMLVVPFGVAAAMSSLEGIWRRAMPLSLASVMAVMGVYYAIERPWDIKPELPSYWVRGEYPEAALAFMRERKVEGPIFNPMEWGGYLIWSAHPDYRPFIDGRLVSLEAARVYDTLIQASPGWEDALDRFGINAVLFPVISPVNGAISPLLVDMARHPEKGWRFVYLYANTAVIVRGSGPNGPNAKVIECCARPQREFFSKAVDYAQLVSMSMPQNPTVYLSMAIALEGAGRKTEARELLLKLPPGQVRDRLLGRIASE